MSSEKYFWGYWLGEAGAVSVIRVRSSASHRAVQWATARSRVAGTLPYDAVLECLERLGAADAGPSSRAAIKPESEVARQALHRIADLYSELPGVWDPLPALAACAVFLSNTSRPSAVVVADAGILIGAVDEAGLKVDLLVDATPIQADAERSSCSLGRGPWPLVAELAELDAAPSCVHASEPSAFESPVGATDLPSTQQGLLRGYASVLERLRALRATGADPSARAAARAHVRHIVERDLAVLEQTARSKHADAEVCVIGRLVASPSTVSFEEQLALGAAVLSTWQDMGTALQEVQEAPAQLTPSRMTSASPSASEAVKRRVESFEDIFPSREQRDTFLGQIWGRSSAHVIAAVAPEALLTGDEFISALQRAHAANPAPAPNAEGISVVSVIKQGKLHVPLRGALPYPAQWHSDSLTDWHAAHALLSATERSGCKPWDASIRIASAHHVCPQLQPLAFSFFEFFASHCWVNAYYSPPRGVRGLACHADGTDVFVVQIEGEKHWVFDAEPMQNSLERDAYLSRVRSGATELARQCVLTKGDVLYLPAGTCHAALATTSPSLHLTFAVRRHTALRVRTWWAQRSARPEELNQSVQRYDTERGRVSMDETLAREFLGPARMDLSASDLLDAYRSESLRIDREATLMGRLLANVDHV
jgi:hypothetical protein